MDGPRITRRAVLGAGAATAVGVAGAGRAFAQTLARVTPPPDPSTRASGDATPRVVNNDIIETRVAPRPGAPAPGAGTWNGSATDPAATASEVGLEPFSMIAVAVPGMRSGAHA